MKNIVVLGSTGSIGRQTLEVIARQPQKFRAIGLSCHSNIVLLSEQIKIFKPKIISVGNTLQKKEIEKKFPRLEILIGENGLRELARLSAADFVCNAIVGSAGLIPSFAALQAGKTLALANKESMVMAGELLMKTAREKGGKIIPVDSELSAIFRLLQGRSVDEVEKIILPASGGPFFGKTRQELSHVTVEETLQHPTWKMGQKITVDSATMMNKGFELIEAHYLFGIPPEKIEIVIHPEAMIHAAVKFHDGSFLAHKSLPDMREAIEYVIARTPHHAMVSGDEAISAPCHCEERQRRSNLCYDRDCFASLAMTPQDIPLHFYEPDDTLFEGPQLAREALSRGGASPALLSFADEIAVQKFLNREISFLEIYEVIKTFITNPPIPLIPHVQTLGVLVRKL